MMKEIAGSSWPQDSTAFSSSECQILPPHYAFNHSGTNVFQLLARREISSRTWHTPKRRCGEASELNAKSFCRPKRKSDNDARHGLFSWVEAESLQNLSAKYCPLVPPPRSTIAAAFSSDGKTLASTHGDHTVKIIDCRTGSCLKMLSGHRRTPWVVRFHPLCPEILASGSLDHEVRLWDTNTLECIGSRDFYRPIASIAFHAKGELLAVASGHKLYMWHYSKRGDGSSPSMVLKTRRSLRAVHFHPHGAPFLLTAEVNDLDSSDSSMTRATSPGYLHYPPPAVFLADARCNERLSSTTELPCMSFPYFYLPSYVREDARVDLPHGLHLGSSDVQMQSSQLHTEEFTSMEQNGDAMCPRDTTLAIPSNSYHGIDGSTYYHDGPQNVVGELPIDIMETNAMEPVGGSPQIYSADMNRLMASNNAHNRARGQVFSRPDSVEPVQLNNILPCRDPACWELPFLQGWLMGQSQAGLPLLSVNGSTSDNLARNTGLNYSMSTTDQSLRNGQAAAATSTIAGGNNLFSVSGRSSMQNHFAQSRLVSVSTVMEDAAPRIGLYNGSDAQSIISRIQAELASSLAAATAAELPCTVKLRLWPHDVRNSCELLVADKCRLTIPHAVLCSEMGAHFSPCGRFLAACVACTLPQMDTDTGLQTQILYDATGAATSPTRHPASARQVIYELRIYSLEEATFGSVLASRAIRAAHCLTSIQFSPTSEHILLAYGRRHSSLLKSIIVDGETTIPIYTILEIYRVSDMELVRVLPSAGDEVNVACFHPLPGGGLVYGTKEGKLRLLQYDGPHRMSATGSNFAFEQNMVEVERYASYRDML